MDTDRAIKIIEGIRHWDDWKFSAIKHGGYEGTIKVRVDYTARNTSAESPDGTLPDTVTPFAVFAVIVGDTESETELLRKIFNHVIMPIEIHEAREAFRVGSNGHSFSPFHPHTISGMRAWGDERGDLVFGNELWNPNADSERLKVFGDTI